MFDDDAPSPEPSTAMAGIAAAIPFLFFVFSCGLYGVTVVGAGGAAGATESVREMGLVAFGLIVGGGVMGAVGAGVCLFLAGRGLRVPAALTLAMAILPWMVGLGFTALGLARMYEALAFAEPAARATMMARGIAESTFATLFGGVVGSAVCAGTAFGMAVCAIGQRAPRRSFAGALIGGALSLPVLGLALWAAWSVRMSGLVLAVAALGAVLACALAGAGIGADEPHGRSGALGAATPIGALLAVVMAAEAARASAMITVFSALASASSEMRGVFLVRSMAELRPVSATATWALPLGSLVLLGLAGWAVSRSRPSVGRLAGAVAVGLVALTAVGSSAAVGAWAEGRAAGHADLPWAEAEGFEPLRIAARDDDEPTLELLLRDGGLTEPDGARVAAPTREAMREPLAERIARAADPRGPAYGVERPARLAVAVDRRVGGPALRAFFGALADARAESVALAGRSAASPPPEDAAEVAEIFPALGAMLEGQGRCRVVIAAALPPDVFERDEGRRRVTVGAEAPDRFEAQPGVDTDLTMQEPTYSGDPRAPLWATLADDATAQSLAETCDRATRHDLQLVVYVDER